MPKTIDLGKLYDPSSNKKQMLAHQVPHRFVLYGGAKGGGKTAWLANESIRLSIQFPGNVGYLCRWRGTDFESSTLLELSKFLPSELISTHHRQDKYIDIIAGRQGDKIITSRIYYGGLTGDEETKTKINSMNLGFFGIDQAEEVTEKLFFLLDGAMRLMINGKSPRYKGLLTCNPDPGWLRDRFIEHSYPDHIFIPALPQDNAKYLPPDYIEHLKQLYPEAMYKRLIEGNWDIDIAGNYLIPYANIRNAVERGLQASGDKIAGVDISRYGDDETVFILRQGAKVLKIENWAHQDTSFTAGRVARLIRQYQPVETRIDVVGIGAGVVDPLKNSEENFNIKEINVGEAPLEKDLYRNKRAEYYNKLAKRFENGEIDIPDHSKLASQLAGLKYKYDGTRLYIESKEDMRKRGEKSPDYADALMLAFSGGDRPSERIRPIQSLTFNKGGSELDKILAKVRS